MLKKRRLRLFLFIATSSLLNACSLLPDNDKPSMSNSEKAALNLQMGVRYLEMNMLESAKEKLEIAYSLDSGNPEILNAWAVFFERIQDNEQAEAFYRAAADRDPENYSIKNNLGHFLCERGKHQAGIDMLQTALDSPYNNRPWLALTNLGICLLAQNDKVKAEEYFRGALQISPEYTPALMEMLKISYTKQQYMSARAFLERYLSAAKPTPETLWYGFQIERALGNRNGANDYKERLTTTFPASSEAKQVKSAISK